MKSLRDTAAAQGFTCEKDFYCCAKRRNEKAEWMLAGVLNFTLLCVELHGVIVVFGLYSI